MADSFLVLDEMLCQRCKSKDDVGMMLEHGHVTFGTMDKHIHPFSLIGQGCINFLH